MIKIRTKKGKLVVLNENNEEIKYSRIDFYVNTFGKLSVTIEFSDIDLTVDFESK